MGFLGLKTVEEKMLLRRTHAAGSRFIEGLWSLLLPPAVCYLINLFFFSFGLTATGFHCFWQGKSMWVHFPHIDVIVPSMKMWVSKMLKENRWDVRFFFSFTRPLSVTLSLSLHEQKGEWEINEDMPDLALLSRKSGLLLAYVCS